VVSEAGLDAAVRAALAGARRAFPTLGVDDERLLAALRARLEGEEDPLAALAAMQVNEVVLAEAGALGDPEAIAVLEARYLPDVRAALGRVGLRDAALDDAAQLVREALLVSSGGRPARLAGYGGRGSLGGWLCAIAMRKGIALRRSERGHDRFDDDAVHAGAVGAIGADDLELAYLKKTYGVAFKEAFGVAFAALSTSDRLLLKQRLALGMTVAAIGALHGVHASTISRWVADARDRLVAATRDEMMRRLGAGRAEVSSLLRLIQSEVDITLTTFSGASHANLPR
jgi:RNA polymerase sigma-70 factor (ECF subfamily)